MFSVLSIMSISISHGLIDFKIIGKNQNEFIYISSNKPDNNFNTFECSAEKEYYVCSIPPVYKENQSKNVSYSAFVIPNIIFEMNSNKYNNKHLIVSNKKINNVSKDILTLLQKASISYFKDNTKTVWNDITIIPYGYKYNARYRNNILDEIKHIYNTYEGKYHTLYIAGREYK